MLARRPTGTTRPLLGQRCTVQLAQTSRADVIEAGAAIPLPSAGTAGASVGAWKR